MNILRFEMNRPTEVALQSPTGVAVEGRYGLRVMFNLADGRVMYVPPIVANKIQAAGIVAGENFHLCKATVKTGQRRSVEWLLERISPEEGSPAHPASLSEAETSIEQDLRSSIEMAKAKKAGRELEAPLQNGNGNSAGLKLVPSGSEVPITKLEHALKTAISAAQNAEKFGSELGYVVRFDADAIKSMAITVLINMSERVQR